jgi:hypothetical protein
VLLLCLFDSWVVDGFLGVIGDARRKYFLSLFGSTVKKVDVLSLLLLRTPKTVQGSGATLFLLGYILLLHYCTDIFWPWLWFGPFLQKRQHVGNDNINSAMDTATISILRVVQSSFLCCGSSVATVWTH